MAKPVLELHFEYLHENQYVYLHTVADIVQESHLAFHYHIFSQVPLNPRNQEADKYTHLFCHFQLYHSVVLLTANASLYHESGYFDFLSETGAFYNIQQNLLPFEVIATYL